MSGKIIAVLAVSGIGLGILYIYMRAEGASSKPPSKAVGEKIVPNPESTGEEKNDDFTIFMQRNFKNREEFDLAEKQGLFTVEFLKSEQQKFGRMKESREMLKDALFKLYIGVNGYDIILQEAIKRDENEYHDLLAKYFGEFTDFAELRSRGEKLMGKEGKLTANEERAKNVFENSELYFEYGANEEFLMWLTTTYLPESKYKDMGRGEFMILFREGAIRMTDIIANFEEWKNEGEGGRIYKQLKKDYIRLKELINPKIEVYRGGDLNYESDPIADDGN